MASATDTGSSDQKGGRFRLNWGSRLGRTIIALNVLGLLILIGGALIVNETRRGLVEAQLDALAAEAETFANLVAEAATVGEPEPLLDVYRTQNFVRLLPVPAGQRLRVFDAQGELIADSFFESGAIQQRNLPAYRGPGGVFAPRPEAVDKDDERAAGRALAALKAEARVALSGRTARGQRQTAMGDRILSVSAPISRVQAVTGVLTLEAGDVTEIIRRQRAALWPFVALAVLATFASSVLLSIFIATPVRRLARAADDVRHSQARAISLPDISRRDDELGDLARSLEAMTHTLSERMDAIERFAADVAHEIRNPITSIRSAIETLDLVKDEAARERLLAILKQDTTRLDRLITDISNASRLDAELSRETPRLVELDKLAHDIVALYPNGPNDIAVVLLSNGGPYYVSGREGPLGQVLRNLIDNARSFTGQTGRKDASVRVTMRRQGGEVITEVDDDGPGIPPENLETVFERFYTSRPRQKGSGATAGNSGLGLSIARQITDAHNGRIWAENRTNERGEVEGARFTLALPAASTFA